MRGSSRAREHTGGAGCAYVLSRGRLILARIACDACGFSIIRLVVARKAMRARVFGGVVIRCKLTGQARFAVTLPCRVLVFSVVAIGAYSAL